MVAISSSLDRILISARSSLRDRVGMDVAEVPGRPLEPEKIESSRTSGS
jgi:hypothetical protein